MKLTFKNGDFVLVDDEKSKTIPLRVAVRFRPLADKIADRVFDRILVKHFDVPVEPLPNFLDPHQVEGVRWILTRSRSYLAHAPGAGKTAQAIIAGLFIKGNAPIVLIVPPDLTLNWEREILKWTAWAKTWPRVYIVGRTSQQHNADWSADFIIVPDSMLTKSWVYEKLERLRPKLLAVDEASRFKEPTAERTKALFGGGTEKRIYYGLVANARHAVLLDGSPMPNRPMELWAPTTGMAPEVIDFRDMHEFGVRYCGARFVSDYRLDWDYSGASHQDELHAKLQKDFMHVVTEDKLNHPERLRSMLFIDDVRTVQMKTWEHKNLPKYDLEALDENASLGDLAKHRQEIGLRKVDWVVDYVRGRLETKNESIIVFAWHREVCARIAQALSKSNPALIIGGTSGAAREQAFRKFNSREIRLIVGNIGAMGRGHNLQVANRVVFAEYSWTDELNKQCEKRASRKGSTHAAVRCDYIVASDSMDEVVLNSVFTKAANVKRVIG